MCKRLFHVMGLVCVLVLVTGLAGGKTLLDYNFSDGSGTTVTDLSGNGNHGTLAGFTDTSAGAGIFDAREGWVAGGGLCFLDDSVRSFVDTPLGLNALPGDFTLEFEASYAGASGWTPAIGSNAPSCCAEALFFGISNNLTNLEVRLQTSGGAIGTHPWTSPPHATRHHVALVYDAAVKRVEVFVNGVSVGAGTRSGATMAGVSTKFRIGNTGWSAEEQWDGIIFGVAISDKKLDPDSFVIPNRPVAEASKPDPMDGASNVPNDVLLSWTPGELAGMHDVYFGIDPDSLRSASRSQPLDVLARQGQSETVFDPGPLEFGKTYYWRVDEVIAASGAVFKGQVWSFKVERYARALDPGQILATASSSQQAAMSPANTINGSGLDADGLLHSMESTDMWLSSATGPQPTWIQYEFDEVYKLYEMWVWNHNMFLESVLGYGFKQVTIEYSINGDDWETLDHAGEFAQGSGEDGYAHNTVVDFGGVMARYVRLTANSNFMERSQSGLSEVRFFHVPVRAREPQPASGQRGAPIDSVLRWRAGREAASHEIHLSDDRESVETGTALVDTVSENRYDAGLLGLHLDQTYYWKIVEVNDAETPARWDSEVWSFSTVESFVIDDFEDYDDDYENYNRIFQVWIDGEGYSQPEPGNPGNGSGSLVGTNEAPWVELKNVHYGSKAMPLSYNNTPATPYSEAERTFVEPLWDWTRGGVRWLVLYFRGSPDNLNGQLYVKINGVKKTFDGDARALLNPVWTMWPIDLTSVDVNLQRVTTLGIGIDGASATGIVYVDDITLFRETPQGPQDPGSDNLVAYYAMENNARDGSGRGNDGALMGGAQFMADPYRGGVLSLDGIDGIIEAPHSAGIGFNDAVNMTVTLWLKPANLPRSSWTGIIAKNRDVSPDDAYGIWISTTNTWHFRVRTTSGNANLPGAPNPTEEWHFVAMTHDADARTLKGYVDGRMIYQNTNSSAVPFTATSPLWIGGAQSVVEYYTGLVDEVRIYNRALSESEVNFVGMR